MTRVLFVLIAFIVDASLPAVASAALCFVLAAPLGAFRQLCSSMMRRTVPVEVADEAGNRSVARLGTNPPPIWFSPAFRLGSWALVTALSLWPALVAATLFLFRGIVSAPFLVALASVLLARWIASAALVRSHELTDAWQALRGSGGRFLKGHTAFVQKLRFSPDGRWLAAASHDDTIRVWDVATRREVQRFAIARDVRPDPGWPVGIGAIAFSGDGALLASVEPADRRVRLYDTRGGRELRVLADHPHPVTAVAVRLDGRRVATAHGETTGAGSREVDAGIRLFEVSTGRVTVWDLATGRALSTLQGYRRAFELPDTPVAVGFTPEGRLLFAHADRSTVRLWDVAVDASGRSRR